MIFLVGVDTKQHEQNLSHLIENSNQNSDTLKEFSSGREETESNLESVLHL